MSTASVSSVDWIPLESPRTPRPRPANALRALLDRHRAPLETRLADECQRLGDCLDGLSEVLGRAVGTQGRGGGRWRPLLTLTAAEACGARAGQAMDAAVAVELTHTASLVLDDLPCMDDATTRRGLPATHRLVGSAGAILVSVGLLSRAVELLGSHPECGGALSADWGRTVGLAGMAGGQAVDVAARRPLSPRDRRLHRAKSAALPAFAMVAGARVAGAADRVCTGLEAFGRGVGWAHQLLDDAADLEEDRRLGRATSDRDPCAHSQRIMRQAHRRLDAIPKLDRNGRVALSALAEHVIEQAAPEPAPGEAPGRSL